MPPPLEPRLRRRSLSPSVWKLRSSSHPNETRLLTENDEELPRSAPVTPLTTSGGARYLAIDIDYGRPMQPRPPHSEKGDNHYKTADTDGNVQVLIESLVVLDSLCEEQRYQIPEMPSSTPPSDILPALPFPSPVDRSLLSELRSHRKSVVRQQKLRDIAASVDHHSTPVFAFSPVSEILSLHPSESPAQSTQLQAQIRLLEDRNWMLESALKRILKD